jgi:hypothetical protein
VTATVHMEQGEESAVEGYQYAGWLRAQVRVSCADSEPTDPSSSTTRGKRGRVDNNATTKRVTTVGEALEKSMGALRSHVGSQSSAGRCRLGQLSPCRGRAGVHHALGTSIYTHALCPHLPPYALTSGPMPLKPLRTSLLLQPARNTALSHTHDCI